MVKRDMEEKPFCRFCGSSEVIKHGRTRYGKQVYYCKACNRFFVLNPKTIPENKKITDEQLLKLFNERKKELEPYLRVTDLPLSVRRLAHMAREKYGVSISHVTIWNRLKEMRLI